MMRCLKPGAVEAEELERTAMEAAARGREESLKQVQEVTEMFVKSLAAGTA